MGVVANSVALTATYVEATTTIVPSDVVPVQSASEAMTCALGVSSAGYNSAVCTVILQGSSDDLALTSPATAAWSTVPSASIEADAADASGFAHGPTAASPSQTVYVAAPSTVVTNRATAAEVSFSTGTYIIPSNVLTVGSTYRIRAVILRVKENGADTSTYRIRGGSGATVLAEYNAVGAAGFVILEAQFTVAVAGASGLMNGYGLGYLRTAQTYGQIGVDTGPTAAPIQSESLNTGIQNPITVTTSQSAQSTDNQDQLVFLTIEQVSNGTSGTVIDVRPYKYLRLTGTVVGAPSADVDFTGALNIIRETPGSALSDTLTVGVSTGGVISPSAAVALQPDADALSVQCVFTSSDFNGSTVVAKVQVSNDGATWFDLPSGSVSATAASGAANGRYVAGPDGTNVLSVHGFRFFRVTATSSANPTVAVSIACHWKVQRDDHPTSS